MNPFINPGYLFPPLLAALGSVLLSLLVARRAVHSLAHRTFAIFLLTVGLSSFLTFFMRSSPTADTALAWEHWLLPVLLSSAFAFYLFTAVYTDTQQNRLFMPAAAGYLGGLAVLGVTGELVDKMAVQSYGYAPDFKLTFYPMALWAYVWISLGFLNVYRAYRSSRIYEDRNRFLYILIAAALPLLGSLLDILPSTYPTGVLGNLGFAVITLIAMRRYQLLDIELVLKKGLAYFIVSTVVALPYVTVILAATQLTETIDLQPLLVFLILVVLALGLQPLWNRVQTAVDKVFFRHRWDLFHTLEEFTRRSRSIAEMERPVYELVQLLPSAVQADGVALLLPTDAGMFVPVATSGNQNLSAIRLSQRSPLVLWMAREGRAVERHEMEMRPQLQVLSDREREALTDAGAHLFVPLHLRERLIGILVLGRKLSEVPYGRDELRLLETVSTQAAVLLDDARLYQTIRSQLEQGRQRTEAFETAARKLALEQNPRLALQGLVDTARGLTGAQSVSMQVWSPAGLTEHFVVSSDFAIPGPDQAVPAAAASTARNGNGVAGKANMAPTADPPGEAPILSAEIRQRNGSYGVLSALGKEGAADFTGDDQRLLNLFALLAEVLLENVQLYSTVVQERATLAAIQSSMAEGLMVLDPQGRLLYLNQVAAAFLGMSEKEGAGKMLTEVVSAWSPDEPSLRALEGFVRDLKASTDDVHKVEVTLVDPAPRDLALTSFPIPVGSTEKMVGLLLRDITLEREHERRRDTFISVASHQLRTPIAVISGFTELLLQRELPEALRRDSLERIYRNTRVVVSIVDDLLNLSRIQTGRLSLNLDRVSVREVGEEIAGGRQQSAATHEIVVEDMMGIPSVVADRDKFVQVISNLLDNAVKYSPQGGRITVSAREEPEAERVVIGVRDSGIGIAQEDKEYLFTIFHRIQRPETMDIKGTGLGLYIVKKLLELMHGDVWLESELGKGTTFYVALPTVYMNSENWVEKHDTEKRAS